MTIRPEQLQPDWLDALALLRRAVPNRNIRQVWELWWPRLETKRSPSVAILGVDGEVLVRTVEPWETLYKIERVEILLHVAARCWAIQHRSLMYPVDLDTLMRQAGYCLGATQEIRERWRLIDYERPLHLLPLAVFEDRPRCKICKGPVATGSGATFETSGTIHYHKDLHEECGRYIHRVIAPQIRAMRERERKEVGK